MNKHEHQAGRLNSLRQGPGVLDFIYYNVWCKLFKGKATSDFKEVAVAARTAAPSAAEILPVYVAFVTEDVVCVRDTKQKFLIDPFCSYNQISSENLYISVTRPGHIGLKRDVLEKLLEQASDIFASQNGSPSQLSYAQELLMNFDFLHSVVIAHAEHRQTSQIAPHKVNAPWEQVPK